MPEAIMNTTEAETRILINSGLFSLKLAMKG